MNSKQFFEAVENMRRLQKEYFRTRSSLALQAAKKQEKVIDEEIARVNNLLEKRNEQGQLDL